jgi:hypothetical protein
MKPAWTDWWRSSLNVLLDGKLDSIREMLHKDSELWN